MGKIFQCLILLALLAAAPQARAKEDLYRGNIPFITAKYCKAFLSELQAAATIKEGLQALEGISPAMRFEVCAEDLALRWEKYSKPQEVGTKKALTPNDPLFYKDLEPKEKAKTILARNLMVHYNHINTSAISNYSFKMVNPSKFKFTSSQFSGEGALKELVVPVTEAEAKELSEYEFKASDFENFFLVWKEELKPKSTFSEPVLSNEEYKSRRLLARYAAHLKQEDRNKTMDEFCEEYQQEQELDRKVNSISISRFYNNDAFSWRVATEFGFTEGQLDAIRRYTSSYYNTINPKLRTPNSMSETEKSYVQMAIRALEKAPSFQGKVIRVATLPENFLNEHQEGKVVSYASFTSTSKRSGWSWPGDQRFLIFSAKNGRLIQNFSQVPHEEEVLFLPNTKFKILKRSPDPTNPKRIDFIMAETDSEGNVIADIPEELRK